MHLLKTVLDDGTEYTKHGSTGYWDEKENALALRALIDALGRIRKPSVITIRTKCALIRSAIENEWLDEWQRNGWKNAKGKRIRHAELWEQVWENTQKHLVFVELGEHAWSSWMQTTMRQKQGNTKGENDV